MADELEQAATGTQGQAAQAQPELTAPADDRGVEGTTVSAAELPAQAPDQQQPGATPTPAPAQGADQAAGWTSARDFARARGFDPGQAGDDSAFLEGLLAQAQRSRLYEQQLQALALERRQPAPEPPQPAAKPKWYNPPEFDPAWEKLLAQDEQGNVVPRPGTPPDVLPKYLAHQQYVRDFARKLTTDPEGTLRPFVAEVAEERARELVRSELAAREEGAHVEHFVRANSAWLHQRDAGGRVILHPGTGQPVLTTAGSRFAGYVREAAQIGVADVRRQESYAADKLRLDLLRAQLAEARQGQAAGEQGRAAEQAVINANRRPNAGGTFPQPTPALPGHAQNPDLSLREQLTQAFRRAGITDQDFADA